MPPCTAKDWKARTKAMMCMHVPRRCCVLRAWGGAEGAGISTGPLTWAPVVKPRLGYWQVQVRAIRVGGTELKASSRPTLQRVPPHTSPFKRDPP